MNNNSMHLCSGNHITRNQLIDFLQERLPDQHLYFLDKCFHEEMLSNLDLSNIDFSGSVFYKANFGGKSTRINGSIFHDADFRYANLRSVNLADSIFTRADMCHANLCFADLSRAIFRQANLENAQIDGIKLEKTIGLNSKSFIERIFEERKADYIIAAETYLALRKNFDNIGDYDSSSWAYYRERVCKRKSHGVRCANKFYRKSHYQEKSRNDTAFSKILFWFQNKSYVYWFKNLVQEWLWGYAQKPTRILIWSIIVVFCYSFVFWQFGLVCIGETECNISSVQPDFYKNFLFSLASFSTSSIPGLIGSSSIANVLSAIEGITGVTFLALFTTSLASRLGDM